LGAVCSGCGTWSIAFPETTHFTEQNAPAVPESHIVRQSLDRAATVTPAALSTLISLAVFVLDGTKAVSSNCQFFTRSAKLLEALRIEVSRTCTTKIV
jgi:hypothetical protein